MQLLFSFDTGIKVEKTLMHTLASQLSFHLFDQSLSVNIRRPTFAALQCPLKPTFSHYSEVTKQTSMRSTSIQNFHKPFLLTLQVLIIDPLVKDTPNLCTPIFEL
jgi:hypothetical protein